MERAIIHLNIADFAVAVERCAQPGLKHRPLIIAPGDAARAVVYDMSEEAFQDGVRKGMPLKQATRICRRAEVLPPFRLRYEQAMTDLIKRTLAYTPLVESGPDDGHLFLDATGTSRLFGPPMDVAWRLHREMKTAFGLDPIWSVAANKLVAKVATRVVKPRGEYIVDPGDEADFLADLPLNLIPGLTDTDLDRLAQFNMTGVAQVRSLTPAQLAVAVQDRAGPVHDRVRGLDDAPVVPSHPAGPVRADHEFDTDTNESTILKQGLYRVVEPVCHQLTAAGRHGAHVTLTLTYADGIQRSAGGRIIPPTALAMQLFPACLPLLDRAAARRIRIRHMRLACTQSCPAQTQLTLFDSGRRQQRQHHLATAVDRIRARYGLQAIGPALTLPA